MSHVYVVALTSHHSPPFSVDGRRIEFINVQGVFAAIERRSVAPSVSEAELRSQHDVVMAIFNQTEDVLPVRFGAWIDRQELAAVMLRQRSAIVDALRLVRGRVQMTIRFLAPRQEPSAPQPSSDRPGRGTEYLQARRDAEQWLPAEGAALRSALRDLVVAERVIPGSSLYHLISRDAVTAYTAVTQPFESATVIVSGPWPPFAFAPEPWL
jgi:gas vesicle protein GvpL/GvpF